VMVSRAVAVAIVVVWALSGLARAEAPKPVEVAKDQPCPYEGLLVPRPMALRAIKCAKVELPACQVERGAEAAKAALLLDTCEQLRRIERDRADALSVQLAKAATIEPPRRAWWKHPVLWGVVGAVVGAGLVVLVYQVPGVR